MLQVLYTLSLCLALGAVRATTLHTNVIATRCVSNGTCRPDPQVSTTSTARNILRSFVLGIVWWNDAPATLSTTDSSTSSTIIASSTSVRSSPGPLAHDQFSVPYQSLSDSSPTTSVSISPTGMQDTRLSDEVPPPNFRVGKAASQGATADVSQRTFEVGDDLTFEIRNMMQGDISISYMLNTYLPELVTASPTTASQLIGIGSSTTGSFASATVLVAPFGWAGRMTLGRAAGRLDYRATKIEGNYGFKGADPNASSDIDVDVSYVDGYSLPVSCSCESRVLTGCNIELFDRGVVCQNLIVDGESRVCVNDPRQVHGPASEFFAPCMGAAYTFDYDDGANFQGQCATGKIVCCIGVQCGAPDRQDSHRQSTTM